MSCLKSVLFLSAATALCLSASANPTVRLVNIGGEECNFQVRVDGQQGDAVGREVSPTDVIRCTMYPQPRLFKTYAHIDGKPVAIDAFGRFSGPAGESGLVVVSHARPDAWYLGPVEKSRTHIDSATYTPWGGLLDEEAGLYFAGMACNYYGGGESGLAQIDATRLMASNGEVDSDIVVQNYTTRQYTNALETTRDFSYSAKYQLLLGSGLGYETNTMVAYPLGGSWKTKAGDADDRYCVTNDVGRRLYPAAFDHDSSYFYAVYGTSPVGEHYPEGVNDYMRWSEDPKSLLNDMKASRSANALGKFRPVEDIEGRLIGFELVENLVTNNLPPTGEYACYVGVVRTFFDEANNREIVYVAGQDGVTAVDVSTTPPTVVHNKFPNADPYEENYPSLNVTGVSNGTPHLVLNRSTGLNVYALMPDLMTLVSTTPIASFTKNVDPFTLFINDGFGLTFRGFAVTEDEKYLFFNAPYKYMNQNNTFHTFLFWNPNAKYSIKETILLFK